MHMINRYIAHTGKWINGNLILILQDLNFL